MKALLVSLACSLTFVATAEAADYTALPIVVNPGPNVKLIPGHGHTPDEALRDCRISNAPGFGRFCRIVRP